MTLRPPATGREPDARTVRFARAVRALRIDAGLSQAELAEETGLSPEAISKLERTEGGHFRLATALRLLDYLGPMHALTLEDMTRPDPQGRW